MDLFAASTERQQTQPPVTGIPEPAWKPPLTRDETLDRLNAGRDAATITERASCLLLEFRKLGITRKVAPGTLAPEGTDPDVLHVAKDIISAPELTAIDQHDGETMRFIAKRRLPAKVLKAGISLIPNPRMSEVNAWLKLRINERGRLVDTFCEVYPARAEESRAKLGTLADVSDYPDVERVRKAFGVRRQWLQFETPASLKEVDPEIYEQEKARAAAAWGGVLEEARAGLRTLCAELVGAMADKLTVAEGDKPKVFRDSLVNNLNEFTKLFDDLNYVAGDRELGALVENIRGLMRGVKADDLRESRTMRAAVADTMAAFKSTLDTMVAEGASRAYFDEAEG